jgi:NAD(P)H-dependent FMN reductase
LGTPPLAQPGAAEKDSAVILLINGSPKPNGNVHRMLEKIAVDTGESYEMVRLSTLKINPCTGCVKCADSNRCVQQDDMAPLYDKIVDADALIVGFPVYFGHANAFTHTFLERLFPLRHIHPVTEGNLAAVVSVGGNEAEPAAAEIKNRLESYFCYQPVDTVCFNSATPPCFICGYGTTCQYGGPARWMTPEEFAAFTEIKPDMFQNFEDHPEVVKACEALSRKLKAQIASLQPA